MMNGGMWGGGWMGGYGGYWVPVLLIVVARPRGLDRDAETQVMKL